MVCLALKCTFSYKCQVFKILSRTIESIGLYIPVLYFKTLLYRYDF